MSKLDIEDFNTDGLNTEENAPESVQQEAGEDAANAETSGNENEDEKNAQENVPAQEDKKPVKEAKKGKKKTILGWGIYGAVLVAIYITFHFFLMMARIPSESMEPTIMVHDWTIGDRNAYNDEAPQRGDIVNFYQAEEDTIMVKRVIGLPGDTVSFEDDHVHINGEELDESAYLDDDVLTECDETFTVPDGCVFLLGDNREVSLDARYWDDPYISYDDIKCQVDVIIPFHKLSWF